MDSRQDSITEWLSSVICDGLPKLYTISFGVSNPAKFSEVIAVASGIDSDTFGYQTIQESVEVIDLKIDHGLLRGGKVGVVLLEQGEDDVGVLGGDGISERSLRLGQAEMLFVPGIERAFGSFARKNVPPKPVMEGIQSPRGTFCPGRVP